MSDELNKYYELLGVAPGTSSHGLKEAYRDLAKVWHPDRFSHDPRLQQKAQEKLKEINEAYEQLTSGRAGRRTRPPSTPGRPAAPHAATARRRRPRFILLTALVFCAAFYAALNSHAPHDARPARDQTRPNEQEEARTAVERQQPESEPRPAAGQPPRGNERAARQPSAEATSGGAMAPESGVPPPRPMPTVTVTIDAVTGLLATRDCPTVSRMTYPAGGEPHQYCTTQHKTKVAAQPEPGRAKDSRLRSVGKGLAAPFKWLGGERGTGAGEVREVRTPGGESQDR